MSAGGIILPDQSKDKPQRGTVVAIGPGRLSDEGYRIPVEGVEAGDHVLFTKYSGEAFRFNGRGEEIFLVEDKDVIAVVSDETDELELAVSA
jgi:chaperonin GroES